MTSTWGTLMPSEPPNTPKFTNAQTILYEIDMLVFTFKEILTQDNQTSRTFWAWRNLECFLLHFRSLIEFFGKKLDKRFPSDLSILKPAMIWNVPGTMPLSAKLEWLHKKGDALSETYEGKHNAETISKYLGHCTEQRMDPKDWNVGKMFDELMPLISEFEELLPDKECPWERPLKPDRSIIALTRYATLTTAHPTMMVLEVKSE